MSSGVEKSLPKLPSGILFYGDPHGEWRPLINAVIEHEPAAVVILGDCGLDQPLQQKLSEIWDFVPRWKWILGNHDVDSIAEYELLADGSPGGDLGSRWVQLDGKIIAGLGGVYQTKVWYPKFGGGNDEPPQYLTRREMTKKTVRAERFRGGVPLSCKATIFPEDHAALKGIRAEVFVCHEAPTSYKHGFAAIDELARDLGARLIVHGHHHHSYEGHTRDGIFVRGLGIAEPWLWGGDTGEI